MNSPQLFQDSPNWNDPQVLEDLEASLLDYWRKGQALENRWGQWQETLQSLAEQPAWKQLAEQSDHIAQSLIAQTLAEIQQQQAQQEALQAQWAPEWAKLNSLAQSDLADLLANQGAAWFEMLEQLPPSLTEHRAFYWDQWLSLLEQAPGREQEQKAQRLRQHLVKAWQWSLFQRQSQLELASIDAARRKLLQVLYQRSQAMEQLQRLFEPKDSEELGRLWDLAEGQWQAKEGSTLEHYADLLKQDATIQSLVKLLGRLQGQAQRQVWHIGKGQTERFSQAQSSEFVGIRQSDDLNHLLPSELIWLSNSLTENLFYQKYLDKKLQTWEQRSKERQESPQAQQQNSPEAEEQGPVLLCLDTSGSMNGRPEQIAKTLCFAVLKMVLQERRDAYLISFSRRIEVLELKAGALPLAEVVKFLNHSFNGGTDIMPALEHSLKILREQPRYQKADILVVSDFVMGSLPPTAKELLQGFQAQGSRFHALCIGDAGNTQVLENFGYQWVYEPYENQKILQLKAKIDALAPDLDNHI
jgi:uncharacterized protein with von Willebrand factor type A (vWA) domain